MRACKRSQWLSMSAADAAPEQRRRSSSASPNEACRAMQCIKKVFANAGTAAPRTLALRAADMVAQGPPTKRFCGQLACSFATQSRFKTQPSHRNAQASLSHRTFAEHACMGKILSRPTQVS